MSAMKSHAQDGRPAQPDLRTALTAAIARRAADETPTTHALTVFNAVDLPDDVASAVMALLAPYSPDIYVRECDADGRAR